MLPRSKIKMQDDYFKILLALKAKRLEIASMKKVEAFKIFHNATLEAIAEARPQTLEDLAEIKGLGAGIGIKVLRYQIDYAIVPYGELGNTHQVSLLVSF